MTEFLKWQWIVFLAPFTLAVLLALASAAGIGGDSADQDQDAEGEAESSELAESDSGIESDAAESESDSESSFSPLTFLGVGYAPLSVLLICLLLFWSVIGSFCNLVLGLERIGVSVSLALVGSFVATGGTARLIKRFLPTSQSFSVARHELIGKEGVAIYPITETSGTVRLYDKLGTLRQLDCRIAAGGEMIPENNKVVVIDYNRELQVFTVQEWNDLVRTITED